MRENSWEGILDEGERILWQGQPGKKLSVKPGQVFESLFGVLYGGFALVWMGMAFAMGGGLFGLFGLPFFAVGCYMVFGKFLWQSYERGHTWYTLTTQAAYIAKDTPVGGRSLKTYPITSDMDFDFQNGQYASIFFAQESYHVNGRKRSATVGFENLENGREVLDRMLDVKKGIA